MKKTLVFAVLCLFAAAASAATAYEHCRCNQPTPGLPNNATCCYDASNNNFQNNNKDGCCQVVYGADYSWGGGSASWTSSGCKTVSCPSGYVEVSGGYCCPNGMSLNPNTPGWCYARALCSGGVDQCDPPVLNSDPGRVVNWGIGSGAMNTDKKYMAGCWSDIPSVNYLISANTDLACSMQGPYFYNVAFGCKVSGPQTFYDNSFTSDQNYYLMCAPSVRPS